MDIHMMKPTRMTTGIHMTSRTCTVPVVATTIRIEPYRCSMIGLV